MFGNKATMHGPKETMHGHKEAVGKLNKSLSRAVDEYAISKRATNQTMKPPNWDSAGNSIELLWCQNKRELEAMRGAQEELIENIKYQVAIDKGRIRTMYKSQADFRRQFIALNVFFKELNEKRKAAEKKITEEMATQTELTRQIDQAKESIVGLKDFRRTLKQTVREMKPYEQVLHNVALTSPDYTSIGDCLNRGDSLMVAHNELHRMQAVKLLEIVEMANHMKEVTKEAALQVLGLKNNLAELERTYEAARNDCVKWQSLLATSRNAVVDRARDKEQAIDGLNQLYAILSARNKVVGRLARKNFEGMMDYIKEEVHMLRDIVNACQSDQAGKAEEKSKCAFEV